MDQVFEGIDYFQPMLLHKKGLGAIAQTNVESLTENFKNIGTVESRKLIELGKSSSSALLEEIFKPKAFKDIKLHIVSTTGSESQMIIKYLKDVSTMYLGHILELFNILQNFHSPQVKRCLISCIKT